MKKLVTGEKLKLAGFNNLTKALSFNLYDFCVARDESERLSYQRYISERYNAKNVTKVLTGICGIIEAQVLAVSDQDYDPWGASSMILMSDLDSGVVRADGQSKTSAMHLDKSHICAHTYPDFHNQGKICTFRIDINISTCGEISPLTALNFMFKNFDSDVVVVDYVVRGFTRDEDGRRVYMDHQVKSIQDYIDPLILDDYHCIDLALQSENIWQTKMLRTRYDTPSYFRDPIDEGTKETKKYMEMIRHEMRGVLHMWPD